MTLDGFIAGPNQSVERSLGQGGSRVHDWAHRLRSFRELHGEGGGETGTNDDVLRQAFANIGATIKYRVVKGGNR